MTTQDQARRTAADRPSDGARGVVSAEPSVGLPQRLATAREAKGVDLYRAERDTKIRARYLEALEHGDWRALPGAVYTKGFLRNYALYLGLDPEDVVRHWRRERGDVKEAEPIVVPRPLAAPRQGLTFSVGVVWAALLTVAVVAFAVYVGAQLLRYAKPPTLEVTEPSVAALNVDDGTTSFVLRGTSTAGATIAISTPGRTQPYRVSASADGTWTAEVELRRGRNQFDISATDPETRKPADVVVQRFITVPFLQIEAPTLTVTQPADGATFENGAIPVQGIATNAENVVVSAAWVGPVAGTPGPRSSSRPGGSPAPSGGAVIPPQVVVAVDEDGAFSTPFELTAGRWLLTVTASGKDGKTTSLARNVTVAFKGVNLVVTIKGGSAWLKVWVDGEVDSRLGQAGSTKRNGDTLTFTGNQSVEVRTGSSGVTFFTLNGTSLGSLGKPGVPETWLFEPPNPPQKTRRF